MLVVGAALLRDGCVLAARRTRPPALAGGWELPGGKVEPGETPSAALLRECREELGVEVHLGPRLVAGTASGDWPLAQGAPMRVWLARLADPAAEPAPLQDHDALAWVPLDQADAPDALPPPGWLPADLPVVRAVRLSVAQADEFPNLL